MARNHRKVVAWQWAHMLMLRVYELTRGFPKEETFDLMSQLCRAVYGVPSNIAEGLGRDSKNDYLPFPYIANTSHRKMEYFLSWPMILGTWVMLNTVRPAG